MLKEIIKRNIFKYHIWEIIYNFYGMVVCCQNDPCWALPIRGLDVAAPQKYRWDHRPDQHFSGGCECAAAKIFIVKPPDSSVDLIPYLCRVHYTLHYYRLHDIQGPRCHQFNNQFFIVKQKHWLENILRMTRSKFSPALNSHKQQLQYHYDLFNGP